VNSEMNDLVGNILRNKFYAYGYKLTTCYHVHANAHLSSALVCYLDATGTETLMLLKCILQGWGQLFLLLRYHFEKAAFSGGPWLLMRVKASLGL